MLSKIGLKHVTIILSVLLLMTCAKKNQQSTKYQERSPQELMKLVTERQIHDIQPGEYQKGDWKMIENSRPPEGIAWYYPWGVTLYGILEVSKALDNSEYENFVIKHNKVAADQYAYLRWQEKKFGKHTKVAGMRQLMRLSALDHCGAMGTQFLEAVLEHDAKVTPEMEFVMDTIAHYISNEQARLEDGTLWRPEWVAPQEEMHIWADDLYMSTPYLIRYGEYADDQSYLNDAVKQIINMASYLQDDDGVWFHAYCVKRDSVNGFKWSRANGWAMVSTIEVLSAMSQDHPQYDRLLEIFKDHINGIKPLQTENGMWRQILNNPKLWEETSSTSMFTYSICKGVNEGLLDKKYLDIADKAIKGLNQNIKENGAILGVCEGTGIGHNLEFYKNRKQPVDDSHGQGPVLLALAEYYKTKN
ncbi:MAG: glycoside hydrolase family 88 protein [Candidatus Marinimicrobia bacterium]|nr:glycoside hydrolase family 88 protein [Candidatus Neomarinimicrobiota bacterium]